ncbi:MAG TPA: efflux RND transporter periplasmic adaptor subunit [Bacteroidota bacterium]
MKNKLFAIVGIVVLLLVAGMYVAPAVFTRTDENTTTTARTNEILNREQTPQEIEYYTCGMHPSVRASEPGKCPICGMTLTPVYKKGTMTSDSVDLTFSVSATQRQLIGVKYSAATVLPLEKTIHAVGKIDYDERKLSVVSLKIDGWIQSMYVDYTGKHIRKGEPLFSLYSPELVSAQEEYLLALSSLNDMVTNNSTPYSSPVSHQQVFERARQRLLLWNLTEGQIKALEERGKSETYVDILSPQDGVVIEKMALAGARVESGMPLYKIADLSTVWLYADIYEYELDAVKLGQEALVRISAFPNEHFRGRVAYIFPYLNSETRSVKVRMEFPNKSGKLKPEMYADAEIKTSFGNVLAIPENSLLNTGERRLVFVDKGSGMFEIRFVTTGRHGDELVEITNGLHAGERVVSHANFLIDAESRVQGVLQRLEGSAPTPVEHKH